MPHLRLLAIAFGLSLLLAAGGLVREVARFGWNDAAGVLHLKQELTRRVADRASAVEVLAQRVARNGDLVAAAIASRDRLPDLFARLSDPLADGAETVSATIWIPSGPAGGHRVLAWSDGPAEDIGAEILASAPTLTVALGAAGLRLIYVQPIDAGGRKVGVAAAEAVLSPPSHAGAFSPVYTLSSSVGALPVVPWVAGGTPGALPGATRVVISSRSGAPLLETALAPAQIANARRVFRWRVAALGLLPWMAWLLVLASATLDRRRKAQTGGRWLAWSVVAEVLIAVPALVAVWLARKAGVPDPWIHAALALTALALVAVLPGGAWWRRGARRSSDRAPLRWIAEQIVGAGAVAGGVLVMAWLWRDRINPISIEKGQLPILPADFASIVALAGVLLAQVAVSWAVAGTLGVLAARWRATWRRPAGWVSAAIWISPALALPVMDQSLSLPLAGTAAVAFSAAIFGLIASPLRRHYRSTSEARRLLLRFCGLLVPVLVAYPLATASADRATRAVIERTYAPATAAAQKPEALIAVLRRAQSEIDLIPRLESLLARGLDPNAVSSQAAFAVWTRTVLSRNRATSEIELFGQDRNLVSHFSLNVPEYQTREQAWQGEGCGWAAFAEVARSVAGEPRMLHAERGVCGADGTFLGAVVLRIIADYRALPFVTSANPYYGVFGGGDDSPPVSSRIPELQVVVYGWSLQPTFVSGRVAWAIDAEIDRQLYGSRDPFWRRREAEGRMFHIYFLNDRGGVYAIGYPSATALQHVTRLAESAAVLVALFVAYLAGVALVAPLLRRKATALRRLVEEIRASFHRKLFLFFVLAAVGPVVLFAIAFGAYMTAKLRADVLSEAGDVVIAARRVFDELSTAQARPGQARLAPSDDVMVLIGQLVDQDVNLFDGPQLVATSQRDLFASGLLPTRTPASVYRQIVLGRDRVHVAEDRIGTFKYLVAAAPIPALGRDAVLGVSLASRQREIEREIDELTRGVLAGAVVLVLFAAALGASVASRVSDPVARLTRATRLIAAGRLDERLVADSADELGRLVDDFNAMTEMLVSQRAELARANQLKAWAEMSRQVAHEVKNPLTPIQLAAEHLLRVHEDQRRPLGPVFDQCLTTILKQVRLLRQIASEFSTFASQPTPRVESVDVADLIESVVGSYRVGLSATTALEVDVAGGLPPVRADRTLLARALTNLVENALQAMPAGGVLRIAATGEAGRVGLDVTDTGVGMDEEGVRRAFEPYFSTKTAGSGLGLANARRNVEICGGTVTLVSHLGRGTTVTVTLPADRPAANASL